MPWLTSFHIELFETHFTDVLQIIRHTLDALWSADGHGDFFRAFILLLVFFAGVELLFSLLQKPKK